MTKHYTEHIVLSNTNSSANKDKNPLHRKHEIEGNEPYYKQGITKHYTENIRLSDMYPNKNKASQHTTHIT